MGLFSINLPGHAIAIDNDIVLHTMGADGKSKTLFCDGYGHE